MFYLSGQHHFWYSIERQYRRRIMTKRVAPYPPMIDMRGLLATLLDQFPSHQDDPKKLMYDLTMAYIKWWQLMRAFPKRHIVATPPIWVVRQIHAKRREEFVFDCLDYLGFVPDKSRIWRGKMDVQNAVVTSASFCALFDDINLAWQPLLNTAKNAERSGLIMLQ
jgi:hypothetical protein